MEVFFFMSVLFPLQFQGEPIYICVLLELIWFRTWISCWAWRYDTHDIRILYIYRYSTCLLLSSAKVSAFYKYILLSSYLQKEISFVHKNHTCLF